MGRLLMLVVMSLRYAKPLITFISTLWCKEEKSDAAKRKKN